MRYKAGDVVKIDKIFVHRNFQMAHICLQE